LGGSFNPAHDGHVHISREALKRLGLDALWWLVSPQNPLKPKAGMAPQAIRLAQAQAVARDPRIIPSSLETVLGTQFTIDTVRALRRLHPHAQFIWLMGADSLRDFHRWKQWRAIARLLPIAVLLRPGYASARWSVATSWFGRRIRTGQQCHLWPQWRTPALVILTCPMDATSATALRRRDPDWATRWRLAHTEG
jgi:nicotinate-nucleotide adenylyltransferase